MLIKPGNRKILDRLIQFYENSPYGAIDLKELLSFKFTEQELGFAYMKLLMDHFDLKSKKLAFDITDTKWSTVVDFYKTLSARAAIQKMRIVTSMEFPKDLYYFYLIIYFRRQDELKLSLII